MITTNKTLFLAAALVLSLASMLLFSGSAPHAEAEIDSTKCETSTITAVAIGNQASTQVLATSSNRAFAIVQQVRNAAGVASSSVSLALNEDVLATVGNGIQLSTTTPTLTFGINTPLPYTGAVHAITDTASTTLRVTECSY